MSYSYSSQTLFPRTLVDKNSSILALSSVVLSGLTDALVSIEHSLRARIDYFRLLNLHGKIEFLMGVKLYLFFSEVIYACIFAMFFPAICIWYRGKIKKNLEIFRHNREFWQMVEQDAPNALRWYNMLRGLHPYATLLEWRHVVLDSPSIFSTTPSEATRRYKAEVRHGKWREPPHQGTISLHVFQTKEAARSANSNAARGLPHSEPHVRIDLQFHPTKGLDLTKARKLLGVEKLSMITDPPLRSVFEPANQHRLSPIAVYDLSKNFTKPIHAFEPCPSKLTRIKRKIHDGVYPPLSFVIILTKSILGFKIPDEIYLTMEYGTVCARRFTLISQRIRPVNEWASQGVWLLAQLVGYTLLLLFAILYQAVRFIMIILSRTISHALSLTQLFIGLVGFSLSSLLQLTMTGRGGIVVFLLIWFIIAEIFSQYE